MTKSRLEAFSDGVIAIIITIMVLELRPPADSTASGLLEHRLLLKFASYVLSFVYIAIYWNNHHHMLHGTRRVNGAVLWANMHLLFWLSLVPFVTSWVGEGVETVPMVAYGVVMLFAAVAYYVLQTMILRAEGPDSLLARAIGRDFKGKISPILYLLAIPAAFLNPWIPAVIFVVVALIWLVPDKRIERAIERERTGG